MKFPKLFHGETPGTYDSLFNRARNLLSNLYTWRGADADADDLSSSDSEASGPAVGNLNQVENVEEVPPPPQAVDIVPLPLPPSNDNNNNNNNTSPQTPPSTPKSIPNHPPRAPRHQRGRNPTRLVSDDEYDDTAAQHYAAREADRVRRGELPEQPSTTPSPDMQDEVLNNDTDINNASNNRVDESTNQNVAIVNNGGDSLEEGNTNNNNTNTNNSSTNAANSNNNTSNGEEGLVLPVDTAVLNNDRVLNHMLEEGGSLGVEGTANNNNTNNSTTNNNISSGEEGLVLNEGEVINEEMEELKDISMLEEEDTNTEELLLDIGAVDNDVSIAQRVAFGPLSLSSRMDISLPPMYNTHINRIAQVNNTSAAGGGDYGSSSDDSSSSGSSSEDSGSNTAGDVSMGMGSGSDGEDMSVDSGGSYKYMDEEDEEKVKDELLNNCMSELDRLSGNVISNIDLNEKSDDALVEEQNEKSDDASVEGKMFEAAIEESVKALDKDVDIDVDAVQGKGKASVVGDQAADSVGASSTAGVVGLRNQGNSCYQNSVTQALYSAAPFNTFITSETFQSSLNNNNPNEASLALSFGDLIRDMNHSTSSFVIPRDFHNKSIKVIDHIVKNEQHDVSEFLIPLLDILHEALNKVRKKPEVEYPVKEDWQNDTEAAIQSRVEHQKRDDSIIKDTFSSQLKCTHTCTVCRAQTVRFEESNFMTIPIPTNDSNETPDVCTLDNCIRQFSAKEILSGDNVLKCERCTERNNKDCRTIQEKVIEPFNPSPIVVTSMNKFKYDSTGRCVGKIDTKVNFDIDDIDIAGESYTLFATCNHHEDCNHYTAYVKNQAADTWTKCDDSSCTPIDAKDVVSKDNYLLFLKRKSDKWCSETQQNRQERQDDELETVEERDTTAAAAALVVRDDTQKSHGQVIGAVSRSSDKVVANDSETRSSSREVAIDDAATEAATSSDDKTDGAIEMETEAAAVKASNRVEGEVKKTSKSRSIYDKVKESTSIEESFHHMLKEGIEEVDPSISKVMIETIEHELDNGEDTCPHLNEMLRSMVTNMKEHLPDDENDTGIESSDTRNSDTDRNSDEEESSDSDDDDDDDNAAADDEDNVAVDLIYYHPGKENMERISDQYILIFGKEVPQLSSRHATLLSGYNRLKQVCLEHQLEAKGLKFRGDHAMDVPIKKIYAVLVSEGYEFKYIEKKTEDKKVVYKYKDPPKPRWGYHENGKRNKNAIKAMGDKGTFRYMICTALNKMNSPDAIKKAQKSSTQNLGKEYKKIDNDTGIPTLRIIDKDESFEPQYLKPSLGDSPSIVDVRKHVNASDDELARYQEEKNEALRREKICKEKKEALDAANDSSDNSQAASPCCHTCNAEGCDINLMILKKILKHKKFFEGVLAAEASDSTLSFESFLSMVKGSKFEFLGTTSENNDIMSQLINLQDGKKKIHGRRNRKIRKTYKRQWESKPSRYFGNAVYAIVRRLCEECYYCLRKIGKYQSASELGGWHGDHMKKYWKKIIGCSQLASQGKISELLIECIKCRLVCGFCHDQHNTAEYDEKMNHSSQLSYDFSMNGRVKHRSARESLMLKEVRLFILELKMRRAFWTGQNAYVTWDTLEFLVWKFFRVILTDLIHFTRDDWVMKDADNRTDGPKRRTIVNFIIMNIIKKLGVKCGCDEDIMNKIPVTMSGIHMDHQGNKNYDPSQTIKRNVDIMIAELKNGNCDPKCIFCHYYVTN